MAHKKAGGSSRNGRDSKGQRLGTKAFGGQLVSGGSIIVRQNGNKFWPGLNAGQGRNFSIYARVDGLVRFQQRGQRNRRYIDILPVAEDSAAQGVN